MVEAARDARISVAIRSASIMEARAFVVSSALWGINPSCRQIKPFSCPQNGDLPKAPFIHQTGFGSETAMRRALQRQFRASARDLRERF
jgi:hypothetical protein